jgi:hypothetical protein
MSQDSDGIVSLRYILANIKARLMWDDRNDQFLLQYIIDAVSELNMFHLDISGTKTVIIDVNEINTIDLPSDYIDYEVIGYIVNGKITSLSKNPNIPIPISGDCGADTNPFPDLVQDLPSVPTFGVGGGYNVAEYTIDKRGHRIIIQGTVPGNQILLKYTSSGISLTEETYIPKQYVPAIRAYVLWVIAENDPKEPMNNKIRKGQLFADEVIRVGATEMPTMDEISDALRMGYRQTPKR